MQNIKEIVNKIIEELKSSQDNKEEIKSLLKKQLTQKEFQHINYISFNEGRLNIGVDSYIWLAQLSFKKELILESLKDKLNLSQIRFFLKTDEQEK